MQHQHGDNHSLGEFLRTRANGGNKYVGLNEQLYPKAVLELLPPNSYIINKYVDGGLLGVLSGTNLVVASFAVPPGYVAYIRKINFDQILLSGVSGVPDTNTTFSIQAGQDVSFFNQDLFVLPMSGPQDTWIIAGPGVTISIFATFDFTAVIGATDVRFIPQLFGYAIPVNNLPTQLTGLLGNAGATYGPSR